MLGLFTGVAGRALAQGRYAALLLRVVIIDRRQPARVEVLVKLLLAMTAWNIKLRPVLWLMPRTCVIILLLLLVVVVHMLAALIALTRVAVRLVALWASAAGRRRAITTAVHQDLLHSILVRIAPVVLLAKPAIRAKVHRSRLTPGPRVEPKHAIVLFPLSVVLAKHHRIVEERSCTQIRLILLTVLASHLQVVEVANDDVLVELLDDTLLSW